MARFLKSPAFLSKFREQKASSFTIFWKEREPNGIPEALAWRILSLTQLEDKLGLIVPSIRNSGQEAILAASEAFYPLDKANHNSSLIQLQFGSLFCIISMMIVSHKQSGMTEPNALMLRRSQLLLQGTHHSFLEQEQEKPKTCIALPKQRDRNEYSFHPCRKSFMRANLTMAWGIKDP